jgi:RNA polymerase sigma factor (sigma-70 family)
MAARGMSEVVGHLRRAALPVNGAGETDEELLRRFAASRDESSFAALLGRHGPMVWGVCRRVLSNHHDAEDAFQATFLVLARKAGSIASRELLANWLYGVAHNTALKARAAAARRSVRERQVAQMPEAEAPRQDHWDDLQPLLDEELAGLPDASRAVVVLCDLEGKTRREAAQQLRVPEGTVASRLARARAILAKRLAGRGIVLSAASLAAVLSQNAAPACVPAPLVSSTTTAATSFAAGQAAAAVTSAPVAALTERVLKAMSVKKVLAAAVLAGILGICLAAGSFSYRTQAAGPSPDAPKKKPGGTDKERLQGTWRLTKAEINGVENPWVFLGKPPLAEFAGDTLTTNFLEGSESGKGQAAVYPAFKFKLDPASRPRAIDLQEAGKKARLGIYRLDGDDLTVCLRLTGKQQRPAAFADYWKDGSYTALLVLKRQPAPAKGRGMDKVRVKDDGKLWAAISVPRPVFHEGDMGAGIFQVNFVVVNDGEKTTDPECGSSRLLVNGKELEDWGFVVANGPKDRRWDALPPKDHLSFGYALGKHFDKPGVYKVVWRGKKFESPELVFRVLPKKGG